MSSVTSVLSQAETFAVCQKASFTAIEICPDSLAGKNVLVTGASRGIGRELALNYCRMGANVFITARDEKKLKEVIYKVYIINLLLFYVDILTLHHPTNICRCSLNVEL